MTTNVIQPLTLSKDQVQVGKLLDAVVVTGTSDWMAMPKEGFTVQGTVAGTGAVTASITLEVSNDKIGAIALGPTPVISLSGTTTASDGFSVDAKWAFLRATLTAVSGTGAAVTVSVGV